MKTLNINGTTVGDEYPVFMVAEIGINHNSDMQITKRLIDAAFATGWNCVKFQKRTPDKCVPEDQKNKPKDTPWGRMTYLEYKRKMEFGKREYDYIDKYCREKPILWSASAWDMPSLDFLLQYDVPFIKIPSAQINHHGLIRAAIQSGKPVILSTGMSTLEEIDKAEWVMGYWGKENYALMHTNSVYPSPTNELNLNMIKTLRDRYDRVIGYSGHEYGLEPSVIAVAMGARIIERHITLDHNMWGTDQAASLEIHAMDMLHKRIKDVAPCLGDGVKRITESEMAKRNTLVNEHWVPGQNDRIQ